MTAAEAPGPGLPRQAPSNFNTTYSAIRRKLRRIKTLPKSNENREEEGGIESKASELEYQSFLAFYFLGHSQSAASPLDMQASKQKPILGFRLERQHDKIMIIT